MEYVRRLPYGFPNADGPITLRLELELVVELDSLPSSSSTS